MPRQPRQQPTKPDVPEAPKPEPSEQRTEQQAQARRPQQTQRSSADARVVEGEVPQVELFVPEPISAADLEKLNVYQRWNRCIGEIGLVPKRGWNAHHKYWFTTDADLNAFVGPLFAKYHLVVIPTITGVERISPEAGKQQYLTRVSFNVSVINADHPDDRFSVDWMGEGADVADKGLYKSFTGGLKYFYMKLLQVATGDDPEVFARTDELAENAARADADRPRGDVRINSSNRTQPQRGGRQQGVTRVQEQQLAAMSRALGFDPRGVAEFLDRSLGSSLFDTVDGMDSEDEQVHALTAFVRSRTGEEIGQVLYQMGEEIRSNGERREPEPEPQQPEPQQPVSEEPPIQPGPPPGYEPVG